MRCPFVVLLLAATGQPAPAGVVELMDGQRMEGGVSVIFADEEQGLFLRVGEVEIPCDEVLSIRFRSVQPVGAVGQANVLLSNGDVVAGPVTKGSESSLTVRSSSMGELELQFDQIRAIEFDQITGPGPAGDLPRQISAELLERPKDEDLVLLLNGDRLPGILKGVGNGGLDFHCALGDITLAFSKMLGICFAPGLGVKTPNGLHAQVVCADSGAITGRIESLDADALRLIPAVGGSVSIPRDQIASITFSGGKAVFLSDLDPAKVVEEPFVRDPNQPAGDDYWWHFRRDRNVSGGPIRLDGVTYRKGLGVHSRCELTYSLGGGYARFLAVFGIDDETDGGGHVTFRVVGDGKTLVPQEPEAGAVSGKDAATSIDVDVSGVSELTLIVDYGQDMHILDRADWADARLIRK